MIVCGVIGYGMRKIDLPIAPLVLGLILGPFLEKSLRTSLEMSAGDFSIFFTRPLVPRAARRRRPGAARLGAAPGSGRGARGIQRLTTSNEGGSQPCHVFATAIAGIATALALSAAGASAQDFPNRPIQLMVAFPAGGSTDIAARIVAAIAEKDARPADRRRQQGRRRRPGRLDRDGAPEARRLLHRLHQPARHQHGDPRSRAQGDLHREGLHADHQPGARSGRDLGQGGQPLQDAAGPVRCGQESAEHHPRRHHRHPLRRPSGDPDGRGGRAGRDLPHRAPRGRRDAVQGDHGRQHRCRLRQRRQHRAAREIGRGAGAGRDGRRALQVPARRADHEGARLPDRHLQLDPRHRRTEGHAGADRQEAA